MDTKLILTIAGLVAACVGAFAAVKAMAAKATKDIDGLKEQVVYKDVCDVRHEPIHEMKKDIKGLVQTVADMSTKVAVIHSKINGAK